MTEVGRASFSFRGSAVQSFINTKSFPGAILEKGVSITHEKYTGKANVRINWKVFGNILEVRCGFTGWHGSSGAAQVSFNVYFEPEAELAAASELRSEIFDVELTGAPGETIERVFQDLGGRVEGVEILGQGGTGTELLEVKRDDQSGFVVRAELARPDGDHQPQEIVQVLATLRDPATAVAV